MHNLFKDIGKNFVSHHWHLGGDEVNSGCWSSLQGVNEKLQKLGYSIGNGADYFIKKEHSLMTDLFPNKVAGYWYRGGGKIFPTGSILEFWGGSGSFRSEVASRKDMFFVFAPSD